MAARRPDSIFEITERGPVVLPPNPLRVHVGSTGGRELRGHAADGSPQEIVRAAIPRRAVDHWLIQTGAHARVLGQIERNFPERIHRGARADAARGVRPARVAR